ncbi:ArnT family glycosyltransferase [Planctomycetaceae bacterium SH139]
MTFSEKNPSNAAGDKSGFELRPGFKLRPGLWVGLIIASATLLTNLGGARLWDNEEPLNAQCAREMMDAGEWIVPTFDGQLRTAEPALLYWCQIAAFKVAGANEWAARLPSALAGLLSVLLVYSLAIRFAAPEVATWSAVSLATMLMFVLTARAATADSLLVAGCTLAVTLFVHFAYLPTSASHLSPGQPADQTAQLRQLQVTWPSFGQWLLIYAASAIAVLAKGPLGFCLPLTVIALTTLLTHSPPHSPPNASEKNHNDGAAGVAAALKKMLQHGWRLRPLTALCVLALLAGPWYTAVGFATAGVWTDAFFFAQPSRPMFLGAFAFFTPLEAPSGGMLAVFSKLIVGSFPWSCLAIPVAVSIVNQWRRGENRHPLFALGIVWMAVAVSFSVLFPVTFAAAISTSFPAAAMLAGWFVAQTIAGKLCCPRSFAVSLLVTSGIGLGLFISIAGPLSEQLPPLRPLALVAMALAISGLLGAALARRCYPELGMRCFVIAAVLICWGGHGFAPAAIDVSRRDLTKLQAAFAASPEGHWSVQTEPAPSWVFYSNRRVHHELNRQLLPEELSLFGEIQLGSQRSAGAVPIFGQTGYLRVVAAGGEETAVGAGNPQVAERAAGRVR